MDLDLEKRGPKVLGMCEQVGLRDTLPSSLCEGGGDRLCEASEGLLSCVSGALSGEIHSEKSEVLDFYRSLKISRDEEVEMTPTGFAGQP